MENIPPQVHIDAAAAAVADAGKAAHLKLGRCPSPLGCVCSALTIVRCLLIRLLAEPVGELRHGVHVDVLVAHLEGSGLLPEGMLEGDGPLRGEGLTVRRD